MRIFIETRYVLFKDNGDMFNEETATTESEIADADGLATAIDIHTEKLGKREQIIRTQVGDLSRE